MYKFIMNNLVIALILILVVCIVGLIKIKYKNDVNNLHRINKLLFEYGVSGNISGLIAVLILSEIVFIILILISNFSIYSYVLTRIILCLFHVMYVRKEYRVNKIKIINWLVVVYFCCMGLMYYVITLNLYYAIVIILIEIVLLIGLNKKVFVYGNKI
ncbi:MAG: hypothetical protein ACK5NF_05285 [Bacilli bacterium]